MEKNLELATIYTPKSHSQISIQLPWHPSLSDCAPYMAIIALIKKAYVYFNKILSMQIPWFLVSIFDQLVTRTRETFGHKTLLIVRASLRDLSS